MYLCSSNLQLIVSLSLGELETILVKNIKKMKIIIYILYMYIRYMYNYNYNILFKQVLSVH